LHAVAKPGRIRGTITKKNHRGDTPCEFVREAVSNRVSLPWAGLLPSVIAQAFLIPADKRTETAIARQSRSMEERQQHKPMLLARADKVIE